MLSLIILFGVVGIELLAYEFSSLSAFLSIIVISDKFLGVLLVSLSLHPPLMLTNLLLHCHLTYNLVFSVPAL